PALFVAVPRKASVLTAGVWTNLVLSGTASSGVESRWFGETDVWIDYSIRYGVVELSAGLTNYLIDDEGFRGLNGSRRTTREVYLGGLVTVDRFYAGVTVWHDVGRFSGAYFEGTAGVRIPMWNGVAVPIGSLWMGGTVGLNASQSMRVVSAEDVGYFADRGWSHVSFELATTIGYLPLGPLRSAVEIKGGFVRKFDERAKLGSIGIGEDRTTPFFGLTISMSGPRCQPKRSICS
ncbi:MAG: hypothetical protein R3282_07320, partial [Rhodothermales bacterium]|nr:hypothetical protein [Rhodothermales bacterium]